MSWLNAKFQKVKIKLTLVGGEMEYIVRSTGQHVP